MRSDLVLRSLRHIELLSQMRVRGMHVKMEGLGTLLQDVEQEITLVKNECRRFPQSKGFEAIEQKTLNVGSPLQLSDLLYGYFDLKPRRRTKSTDKFALKDLRGQHPIVELVEDFRALDTMRKNFLMVLLKETADGVAHPEWRVGGTVTWRISCAAPNLQNQPSPDRQREGRVRDYYQRLKRLFVPKDGHLLVSADFSQMELKIAASLAGEEKMLGAFREGRDIHLQAGSDLYAVPLDKVTKEQRSKGKTLNFGILYGISEYGMDMRFEIPEEEGRDLLSRYWQTYPAMKEWMNAQVQMARDLGYVESPFGRRRHLSTIKSDRKDVRRRAERQATNMPVQSAAGEITLDAMLDVENRFPGLQIAQVHDSVLLDVPEALVGDVVDHLPGVLEAQGAKYEWLKVPLTVDVEVGPNWCDMKPATEIHVGT